MLMARHRARLAMQERNDEVHERLRHSSVRRRLFADDASQEENPGDEDNVRNKFFEELQREAEAKKEKWNFDFQNEKPLPGRWKWEKIAPGDATPNEDDDDQRDATDTEDFEDPVPRETEPENVPEPGPTETAKATVTN